jgi:uncharacterized phage protein gp47/JayE
MAYGLTPTGFVPKTFEILREEFDNEMRDAFGASIDLSDSTPLGHLIAIMVERLTELWQLAEVVNSSQDPDKATGDALEAIALLTGTFKAQALSSAVTLTMTGTATTVIASGSRAETASTGTEFETTESTTLVALTAWAPATGYGVGDRRSNSGRSYVVITAGTSAGSGGPTTTADDITDNTVHWRYLGEGTAAGDAAAETVEAGPLVAVSGDITTITTPVGGWQSVINLLDADPGRNVATDAELRVQRDIDVQGQGAGTPNAIRKLLLDVDDVTSVTVFYNDQDNPNGDGVPGHSVEALVMGGDDQEIAEALFRAGIAAGIRSYGNTTVAVLDSQGTSHDVNFTRPDEIEIYVDITVEVDVREEYDLVAIVAAVELAIVTWGDARDTGHNVRSSAVGAQAFTVEGVIGTPTVFIGTSPAPASSATIGINARERALFDTSRIDVTVTEVTP